MKVFVKKYPEKGEFPEFKDGVYQGYFHTEFGLVKYCKYDGWKLARKYPDYFLEEIELPREKEIQSVAPKTRCVNQFWNGANYILNLLKQR